MDYLALFGTAGLGAFVGGLVTALVSLRISERKLAVENITQERKFWREKIRELLAAINSEFQKGQKFDKHKIQAFYVELQCRLNPHDERDRDILDVVWEMQTFEEGSAANIVLSEHVSLLLKHDWDRAKLEAKPLLRKRKEPERTKYEDYEFKRVGG